MQKTNEIITIDSKEFFVEFLNAEIEQLREDIKTPGWSMWAIVAAIASLAWLLITEVENKVFNLGQTLLVFLLMRFVVATFFTVYDLLRQKNSRKKIQYARFGELIFGMRLKFIVSLISSVTSILIAIYFSGYVNGLAYYSLLLFHIFLIISPLFIYVLFKLIQKIVDVPIYIPDPFKNESLTGTPVHRFLMLINFLLLIFEIFWFFSYGSFYIQQYGNMPSSTTISGIKIALLSVAILYLLSLISHYEFSSPTIKSLIDIRRDLIFDNISLEVARDLAEIALNGLDKAEIIQIEVAGCTSTLQKIDSELNNAIKKNKAASNILSEMHGQSEESVMTVWDSLRDVIFSNLKQARLYYLSDKNLQEGLTNTIRFYGMLDPANNDYKVYMDRLGSLYDQVAEKYHRTISAWLYLIFEFEGEEKAKSWLRIAKQELAAEVPENFEKEQSEESDVNLTI